MHEYRLSLTRILIVLVIGLLFLIFLLPASYFLATAVISEEVSIIVTLFIIGVIGGTGLFSYWTFEAVRALFDKQFIRITDSHIEVGVTSKTKAWGRIPWDEVEGISINDHSTRGLRLGSSPRIIVSLQIKKGSRLYSTAYKPTLVDKRYLHFNIYFLENTREIERMLYEKFNAAK